MSQLAHTLLFHRALVPPLSALWNSYHLKRSPAFPPLELPISPTLVLLLYAPRGSHCSEQPPTVLLQLPVLYLDDQPLKLNQENALAVVHVCTLPRQVNLLSKLSQSHPLLLFLQLC